MDQSTSAAAPQTTDADNNLTSAAMDAEKSRKATFVMQHKPTLIQRVSTVMAVVDSLGARVHPETYNEIDAKKTTMKQMRTLYMSTIVPGGTDTRAAFYDALMEHQRHLLVDLGAEPPPPGAELPPPDSTDRSTEGES